MKRKIPAYYDKISEPFNPDRKQIQAAMRIFFRSGGQIKKLKSKKVDSRNEYNTNVPSNIPNKSSRIQWN